MFTGVKTFNLELSRAMSSCFWDVLGVEAGMLEVGHVCAYAPRTAQSPDRVGRAAHPASSGTELQGDLAPESIRVPPPLHTACWCFTSALAFKSKLGCF